MSALHANSTDLDSGVDEVSTGVDYVDFVTPNETINITAIGPD